MEGAVGYSLAMKSQGQVLSFEELGGVENLIHSLQRHKQSILVLEEMFFRIVFRFPADALRVQGTECPGSTYYKIFDEDEVKTEYKYFAEIEEEKCCLQ